MVSFPINSMLICHSYVSLPEGKDDDFPQLCQAQVVQFLYDHDLQTGKARRHGGLVGQ